jgi:hypothetical protein
VSVAANPPEIVIVEVTPAGVLSGIAKLTDPEVPLSTVCGVPVATAVKLNGVGEQTDESDGVITKDVGFKVPIATDVIALFVASPSLPNVVVGAKVYVPPAVISKVPTLKLTSAFGAKLPL